MLVNNFHSLKKFPLARFLMSGSTEKLHCHSNLCCVGLSWAVTICFGFVFTLVAITHAMIPLMSSVLRVKGALNLV